MRVLAVVLLIQIFAIQSPHASPVTLKCTTSSGDKGGDLIVDVEKKTMTLGFLKYDIFHVNDSISVLDEGKARKPKIWVGKISKKHLIEFCKIECFVTIMIY